jgi:Tfp pilus assembly protein PilX
MAKKSLNNSATSSAVRGNRARERGAALATSLIILTLLGAISMTVLAVVTNESRIAGSDLQRTQTFYAAASGVEKMTNDFCQLFTRTSRPTTTDLNNIAASYPSALVTEGFSFSQTLAVDNAGVAGGVTIQQGPFSGLTAAVTPYILTSTATKSATSTEVRLQRKINNYLVPIFQFGIFSNEDIELHPGPPFAFNGRVHANGNIYVNGDVNFLAKVTTPNEVITDVVRNGSTRVGSVSMTVGGTNVPLTMGSMVAGPNIVGATVGQRGYFPGSPNGTINASWDTVSVAPATGVPNQFGGQLLTRTTGGSTLRLPIELDGFGARELIKRRMPNDTQTLSDARFHSKSQIRILLEDENPATADVAGIPANQGVKLSVTNTADPYYFKPQMLAGGKALWRISDAGAYLDTASTAVYQGSSGSNQADTVRNVRNPGTADTSANGRKIPGGSGISGRVLIQIVDSTGVARDVTRDILSMGVTVGEPNAIVMLQRPLWTAFTQGARDASSSTSSDYLTAIANNTNTGLYRGVTGEIATPTLNSTYGYLNGYADDATPRYRADAPPSNVLSTLLSDWGSGSTPSSTWNTNKDWNAIVPINVYNVREGYLNSSTTSNAVYERGITSVVEINMKNLARWVDGIYDSNLLNGTNAVSTNIGCPDGYTVYVSDRRGDRVKAMVDLSGANVNSSNGMADNEDIYGPNGNLDPGEDVQGTGSLVKDTLELPDPAVLAGTSGADTASRIKRAISVAAWTNSSNYFRRAVRLFNGEDLQLSGAAGKLSATEGITIASENMVYIWGNYNTTGIDVAPPNGVACLNDGTGVCKYNGEQVPASLVCDAFFPLSKTWFDSLSAMYPDDLGKRVADAVLPGVTAETSMRAGVIAGNNLSALAGSPDAGNSASLESRLNGGMHNFPRFLENWDARWNFVGSFIPLYRSTQAVGQYNADSTIYSPPTRDWAFDVTFKDPTKLPPGTPLFQYIEPTGFKQVLY